MKAQKEQIKANELKVYQILAKNIPISHKQSSETKTLQEQLKVDPKSQLIDKQKNLLERAEK